MNIFNTKVFDRIIEVIEKWYYIILSIILLMALVNLFYNLGTFPINSWDEARHGVNAYEMIKKNNYIVNTYAYRNDYWNLKPPISYWAIIWGYKLMGFNPLGLRFFSAVAGSITILVIAIFTLYKHGRLASLIATVTITTTVPYILEHSARSGDADSIFILFFTISVVSIALIEVNIKWLYSSGLFFALAFLTKSWHAGNIVVIGGIYLLVSRILFKLKRREIGFFILSVMLPIMIWIILRYSQDGIAFFANMLGYDLIARTSRTLEGHIGTVYFYIEALQDWYFYWLLVLIAGVVGVTTLLKADEKWMENKNYVLCIFLWIAVPFLLYTKAKTKIYWYILPIYPAMAIAVGASSSKLLKHKNRSILLQFGLSFMIILAIWNNQNLILQRISNPKAEGGQLLIQEIGKIPQYKGKRIYINSYEQSYLLSAELYGDFIPGNDGTEGFLKDNTEGTLLLVHKDKKEVTEKQIPNLKVVAENEVICIFTK